MKQFSRCAFPITAMAVMAAPMAEAADYDPVLYPADEIIEEYVPVEIGSGWYIRGDLGYTIDDLHRNSISIGAGVYERGSTLNGSIAMGYQFNSFLRSDFEIGYVGNNRFGRNFTTSCNGDFVVTNTITGATSSTPQTRACEGSDYAENESWAAMANVYADLGTFVGFTPYVGAGVGVSYNKYQYAFGERVCNDETRTVGIIQQAFLCDGSDGSGTTTYPGVGAQKRSIDFTWSLSAGVAYQLTTNTKVDVGYRYMSTPTAEYVYDVGGGNVGIGKGIDAHQIRVGLRYELW